MQGNNAAAVLSDEEILEIEPESGNGARSANEDVRSAAQVGNESASHSVTSDAAILDGRSDSGDATQSDAETGQAADAAKSSPEQEKAADEPAWVAALDAQPEAAAEARRWHEAAKDVAAIDQAYFSADAGTRAGLATRLYESDPGAFRAMLAESARTLAARDPEGLAELARQLGVPADSVTANAARSVTRAARGEAQANDLRSNDPRRAEAQAATEQSATSPDEAARPANSGERVFPAEAYRAFESTTNDDVARQMQQAIDTSLGATLPAGIPAGARRRIGEDIFREVHASLTSDRELSRRVSEALRDWRFDAAARQQVVALVSGRARAVLPEVARRVVTEWTSSVLASDRAKTARIDAAVSRKDMTGGRLPEPVASNGRARNIDYGRMSDEQIMEM
jgi:hypothetical protein